MAASIVDAALAQAVERLMRTVRAEVVMPRFRALAAEDVMEKGPGDLVTVADRLSEERLTAGLLALLPEARVVGEEAVAADPTLLDGLAHGLAWIVDPIDGTLNYAEGVAPFAIMVGLLREGVTEAGWILDCPTGRMTHAIRDGGAFVDGQRVVAKPTGVEPPLAALASMFLSEEIRADFAARIPDRLTEVAVPRCAGEQYPRLVLGQNDVAFFWRSNAWDHVPGSLILTEAGGRIAHPDGTPYRPGEPRFGLLAAASPDLWDRARTILFG